jgi:hypothetical protein
MNFNGLLVLLTKAPSAELDESVIPKIRALIGKDNAAIHAGIKEVLDECARVALASDFTMATMHVVLNETRAEFEKSHSDQPRTLLSAECFGSMKHETLPHYIVLGWAVPVNGKLTDWEGNYLCCEDAYYFPQRHD